MAASSNTGPQKLANSPVSPPPITTSITPVKDWSERATPRAQTRQEFDPFDQERFKKQRSSSLEGEAFSRR